MRYYRLNDDVHVPGRWHIGDVSASSGRVLNLLSAERLAPDIVLSAPVTHVGKPLRYCINSFGVPVAKRELAEAIASVSGSDVQLVPIVLDANHRDVRFAVPHCLRTVACMDEARSEYVKWSAADNRPDLIGQYRMVTRLAVDASRVPRDAHFFRVLGWPVALVVSQSARQAMEQEGCIGAKFEEIE